MDTLKYELLLTSLEIGSITAAAEKMGYTQSGVSHMLNSLEDELGVKIIIRNRNGVKPTAAGDTLIPYIKKVVAENNKFMQAVSEVSGLLKGSITIGSLDTISTSYLPKIITEFKKIYPNIEFILKSGTYQDSESWLIHKDVDCGFVLLPTDMPFKTFPVVNDRMVIVSGKEYQPGFADPKAVTLEELLKEEIILIDGIDDYDITRIFSSEINNLQVNVTTADTFAAIKMIQNNLGLGVMSILLASEFSDILNIYEFEEDYNRTLALAYSSKKDLSPIAKKFVEFIESGSAN